MGSQTFSGSTRPGVYWAHDGTRSEAACPEIAALNSTDSRFLADAPGDSDGCDCAVSEQGASIAAKFKVGTKPLETFRLEVRNDLAAGSPVSGEAIALMDATDSTFLGNIFRCLGGVVT